jgi:hydroxyethylthiazole kinase-like uncharacterized protein yjeF
MMVKDLDWSRLQTYLPPRAVESNKRDYGHALLIGGNAGMAGAIMLASLGAARAGAGLTSVATHPQHAAFINVQQPEIMVHAIAQQRDLTALLLKATVLGIGPGLGQDRWARKCFQQVLRSDLPLIIDADGLNLLAKNSTHRDSPAQRNWILTPHPGEAARLLDRSIADVQADRVTAIKTLQHRYGGTIVLKGHHTLIATPQDIYLCKAGNPGMASGGMGDLLTGIITGLVAQQLPLDIAAQIGVYIHATAGDKAAIEGMRGMLATDLLPFVRTLLN